MANLINSAITTWFTVGKNNILPAWCYFGAHICDYLTVSGNDPYVFHGIGENGTFHYVSSDTMVLIRCKTCEIYAVMCNGTVIYKQNYET